MLKKILKNQDGMALALIVMVMTVLIILGTSILGTSVAGTRFSVASEKNLQAEYIAKAGADLIAQKFTRNETFPATSMLPIGIGKSTGTATVTMTSTDGVYKIQSTGIVGNAQRTINLYLRPLELGEVFDGIWQTSSNPLDVEQLDVSGYPTMQVPPGTPIPGSPSPDFAVAYRTTNVLSVDAIIDEKLGYLEEAEGEISGSIVISEDSKYPELDSGTDITFDASNPNITVLIEEINGNKNELGTITVSGSGIVHLFINDYVSFKGNIVGNGTLIVYVGDGKSIEFQTGHMTAWTYIYAPFATVGLQSGNDTLIGAVVAQDFVKSVGAANGSNGDFEYRKPTVALQTDYINIDGGYFGYEKNYYSKQ